MDHGNDDMHIPDRVRNTICNEMLALTPLRQGALLWSQHCGRLISYHRRNLAQLKPCNVVLRALREGCNSKAATLLKQTARLPF